MTERRRLISRAKIANGIARLFSLSFSLFLSLFLSLSLWWVHTRDDHHHTALSCHPASERWSSRRERETDCVSSFLIVAWIFDRSSKNRGREFFQALRREGAGFTGSGRTSLILLFIEPARWRFPRQKGNCKLVPGGEEYSRQGSSVDESSRGWLLFMNLTRLIGEAWFHFFLFRPMKIFLEKIDSSWRFRFNEERNRNFIFW